MSSDNASTGRPAVLLFGATGDLAKRMLIPSAIHCSPEALKGGPLGKLRDGDRVRVCAGKGELTALVEPQEWDAREQAEPPVHKFGTGRELFAMMRHHCDPAEKGASAMLHEAGL